jgi:large subunit ribosomal protein L22
LDQIRGRSYEEALMILEYLPYRACEPVIKTLLSAAANAKNNMGLKKKDLYVSECYADEGPILKRVRARAQGRANAIHKPTCHVVVKVKTRAE